MLFTIFKYLALFQRYSSFINTQISQVIMSLSQPNVEQNNMMKKDISANLYQKCLILCIKIPVDVLHNIRIPVVLSWQHTGFQISLILETLLITFGIPF